MGLTFTVGNPSDVFSEPFATIVTETFVSQFGAESVTPSTLESYYTEELGWSGWEKLQTRAVEMCGREAIPHFLSMPAWFGVYLPVETEVGTFEFPDKKTPLDVGCLTKLISELELIGQALELPTDDAALKTLFRKYMEDDDLIDEDMDVQTYAQLLPCARVAKLRQQPLWIVK